MKLVLYVLLKLNREYEDLGENLILSRPLEINENLLEGTPNSINWSMPLCEQEITKSANNDE